MFLHRHVLQMRKKPEPWQLYLQTWKRRCSPAPYKPSVLQFVCNQRLCRWCTGTLTDEKNEGDEYHPCISQAEPHADLNASPYIGTGLETVLMH